MPALLDTHILFVRLYLSEHPGGPVQHLEYYEAMPIELADTAEGQRLFNAILNLVREKNPTFRERGAALHEPTKP